MDYCNSILYGVKLSSITKLQSVQNEAARIVSRSNVSGPVSELVFHDLHWLKVKERIVFKLLLLVHKYFIGKSPLFLDNILVVKDTSRRLLYTNFRDTPHGRRAFSYTAPRLWNHLTENARLQDNTEKFKTVLKTILFTNSNNIMHAVRVYNC